MTSLFRNLIRGGGCFIIIIIIDAFFARRIVIYIYAKASKSILQKAQDESILKFTFLLYKSNLTTNFFIIIVDNILQLQQFIALHTRIMLILTCLCEVTSTTTLKTYDGNGHTIKIK